MLPQLFRPRLSLQLKEGKVSNQPVRKRYMYWKEESLFSEKFFPGLFDDIENASIREDLGLVR